MTHEKKKAKGEEDLLLAPPERQAQLEDMFQLLTEIGLASRLEERKSRPERRTTPLTILSGFLGAGKTTLLNELLAGDHGLRLAVIVNDFGAINIDASLIRSEDAGVVSLENGCVCCSSAGQLGDTLERLVASDPPPDAIVLESSGVADPRNTIHVALVNPNIELDAVVTVVDAETALQQVDDPDFGHLVRRQFEAADIAVLNKADLVTAEQMSAVQDWVRSNVPAARLMESEHGQVPARTLLGIGASRPSEVLTEENAHPPHHDEQFGTWTFSSDVPLNRSSLLGVISTLPEAVIRAKGVLHITDDPDHRVIFQLVGKRWNLTQGKLWGLETPCSNLVLIGTAKGIHPQQLKACFRQALSHAPMESLNDKDWGNIAPDGLNN